MGCGRVGSTLARDLEHRDHTVSVIDSNEDAFRRLGPSFRGSKVTGIGFDRDVLEAAGIHQADAFAAVSSGDNSNHIAARVARETVGIQQVVAPRDARGDDVGVVAARDGGECLGTLDAGLHEHLAVIALTDHLLAPEVGAQPAERLPAAVDHRDFVAEPVQPSGKGRSDPPTSHDHDVHRTALPGSRERYRVPGSSTA